ncbi:hypothetical protein NRIC_27530 [Enterococcus florum]|uniref:Uncharacterized protein n=1 Tax=Enterococcus florum TaxID=2480627 RepID=A0A4P5PGS7_9ENTE|nr:hypothetical protein [Enterococcus florum]GCF94862.1 hypothetical protein NRIC_27530 [Enterococcus florum]
MEAIEWFLTDYLGRSPELLFTQTTIRPQEYHQWKDTKIPINELPLKLFTALCSLSQLSYEEVLKLLVRYELCLL